MTSPIRTELKNSDMIKGTYIRALKSFFTSPNTTFELKKNI